MGIKANYYLIDAVIALTVCYKAFDNLQGFKKYFSMASPNLLIMVTVFGLIHGFGLSTRLQQLPLGQEDLVWKILSFNVGVELGQIAALSVMLIVLTGWRKRPSFQQFSGASNVLLLIIGSLLFLFQLHGYLHSAYPDDFPLNKDDHSHTHEDMADAERNKLYQNRLNLNQTDVQTEPVIEPEQEPTTNPSTHSHHGEHAHEH
jgi:hypothetical protein